MQRSLFVISDLHLGGAEGYQMCPPAGQKLLAEFVQYLSALQTSGGHIHLVLNGDVVDFLAEEDFSSFTSSDKDATDKLDRLIHRTLPVWNSLAAFAVSGARLTLLLGNHDVELSFPGPRALLVRTLGAHVEFIYDNEAFTDGDVIVEHGNRYDQWNVVSHDKLRATRSALSRREPAPTDYLGPPGSQVVKQVLTPLKMEYPWIDLLKPEGQGMFPILAAIKPSAMKAMPQFVALLAAARRVEFSDRQTPLDPQNIAATSQAIPLAEQSAAMREALDIAGLLDPQNISGSDDDRDLLTRLKEDASSTVRKYKIKLLTQALRFFTTANNNSFNTQFEQPEYLTAARASAENGFKVIVYGHTHLAKQIDLGGGAVYLNTGTWADLMQFPATVFAEDQQAAWQQVDEFVDDLMAKQSDKWRCRVPTFARIDFESDKVTGANIHVFESSSATPLLIAGRMDILARKPGA